MEEKLGPFVLQDVIGQGGMGKVYKAYDPRNHRIVALKVIKDSLINNPKSKKRFLKEAYIHAGLSHPAIIPIHGIEIHEGKMGYSMPFIEGATLKSHLFKLRDNPAHMSLKERLRHIIRILEALDYTHKMGFVHRDIKADNIFIGLHDETYLFDWGLALKIGTTEESDDSFHDEDPFFTKPGKIPGTLTHLAPERAFGEKGSIQSDIFSLGVVLYQLLTCKMPFYRKDLDHFKQIAGRENFTLPSELNLKENIDEALDLICTRALDNDLQKRYKSTKEFKADLQKVLDGLPVWKDPLVLDIKNPSHWLFQDILPLGSYLALTQKSLSWGLLSVPSIELIDNYRLDIKVSSKAPSFKIYLNLARDKKGFNFDHSYIIHVDPTSSISLHQVFALLEEKPILNHGDKLELSIEKTEDRFQIFLNHKLVFDVITRVPSICPFLGIVIEDTEFSFESIKLFKASTSKQISCLKLGDNLLWHKCYDLARKEYDKIFTSFQDHIEGQEALFRIGYSYILEADETKSKKSKLLNLGIEHFELFRKHKASPWEYWGKALIYEKLSKPLEVMKCFELGFRKYPRHAFTEELKEELVTLFSKKSVKAKKEALMLAFIALRFLDEASFLNKYPKLIDSLEEELSDIFTLLDFENLSKKQKLIFALSFCLDQKSYLQELLSKSENFDEKKNALFILCHLNASIIKSKFVKETCALLSIPSLIASYDNSTSNGWILAKLALALYGKCEAEDIPHFSKQAAFLKQLTELISKYSFKKEGLLDLSDQKILEAFKHSDSKKSLKETLQKPFFQESERFIRSNFIISLLDKKPLDYFGYDKACLEFAIKALF